MDNKQWILVSGSHRSGTTWMGNMLSLSEEVTYIHEPFNIGIKKDDNHPFKQTFEYITKRDSVERQAEIKSFLENAIPEDFHFSWNKKVLLKDPIAVMSAEWIAEEFDANVVMMVRHPAAFIASLKIKNWRFDFNNYTRQPRLMEEVLYPFKDEIEAYCANPPTIIDQGILLWRIIYSRILDYQKKHPEWVFVRHEDVSMNPLSEIKKIYQKFGMSFNEEIQQKIEEATSAKVDSQFKRDSRKNVYAWLNRLSEQEIAKIKRETWDVAQHFYTEDDWQITPEKEQYIDNPHKVIANLPVIDHKAMFNIDEINHNKVAQMEKPVELSQDFLVLKGWAVDADSKKAAGGVYIDIDGYLFPAMYGHPRKDVAKHFDTPGYDYCGFEASFSLHNVPKGNHRVSLKIMTHDQKQYYSPKHGVPIIIK